MQTFSDIIKSRAQPVEKKGRFKVQKVDEDKRLVFGWANVSVDVGGNEVVDLQGDMIDPETLEAAAYKFAELYRDGGEMHERTGTAVMVESVVLTEEKQAAMGLAAGTLPVGWWIGFRVTDDDVWEKKFSFEMMDKPVSFYAFEMLYWCGIREGELLALTPADFNFDKETVTINKSYQRLKGQDVITSPKTKKSNRTIKMPKFLCEEMKEYLGMLYGLKKKDRIFTVTKSYLHHEMDRGAKAAGVKRIRIHDLRHSHISLLIDMGFSAVAIADRVGHESIDITYQYAHLFPSKQIEMAEKLDDLGKGDFENVS